MTITDLVRDTGKAAAARVEKGESLTIVSGGKPLFRLVPPLEEPEDLPPEKLAAVLEDLQALAGNNPSNPVIQLRSRRA